MEENVKMERGAISRSENRSGTSKETVISMKITIWKLLRNVNGGQEPGSSKRNFDEDESLVMKKVQVRLEWRTNPQSYDKDQSNDA
ncbi:hypothetical protein F2Q70_00021627 [Brassica cretica]|uniref:Uncharacterized protein n=1 Tax=Brassica cretica TaxID=69181 RepID=A0A8S9IF11_BRACR|nr:hypothetical protein F2Q70_00021627 [Brassica cretica]KAF2567945.1 hypothetical protein F2Q68_00026119 [Brassica cretica]